MSTSTQASPLPATGKQRVFQDANEAFRSNYNRAPFQYKHNLAGHPLFELPRLRVLAERILHEERTTKGVLWQNHDVPMDAKWSDIPKKKQMEKVGEAISNLDKSGSWVLLYSVQSDPEYGALLNQIIDEIEEMVGVPIQKEMSLRDAYIFLGSPGSVTPYHIDHETTFLLQVHGNRTANIWDRSVVPEKELENYYLGFLSAAKYTPEIAAKAHTYALNAGTGVHHPCCAPHAFRNDGGTYSIALQINFFLNSLDVTSRIYQINGILRRMGLKPTPPGKSPGRDRAKVGALGLFSKKNPKTKMEILRSGLHRVAFPALWAHSLKKKLKKS